MPLNHGVSIDSIQASIVIDYMSNCTGGREEKEEEEKGETAWKPKKK